MSICPDLFFDERPVRALLSRLTSMSQTLKRPITIMEVCGTHTHVIARAGLRDLLPESVRLISGPGCPVCVTPLSYLDRAEALARLSDTCVCTFGDLFRVPSSLGSLERCRAEGADIQIVYSPRDALNIARNRPNTRVIFLGVGFETTTPLVAAALEEAEKDRILNFLVLSGHKRMPPPMRALAGDPDVKVDGFILPGHVSVIAGFTPFRFLAEEFSLPSVVAGFSPVDVLRSVMEIVTRTAEEEPAVVNLYGAVVTREGNKKAQALMDRYFFPGDGEWRGLGVIQGSGLHMKEEWVARDALHLEVALPAAVEPEGCRCGDVLKGIIRPSECPLFADTCTPESPVGACMVSGEGTCSAWYRYHREKTR